MSNPWVYINEAHVAHEYMIMGKHPAQVFWGPRVLDSFKAQLGEMASCKLDRVLKRMHCLGAPKARLVWPFWMSLGAM